MASISKYKTKTGVTRFRVHYRDPERRQRSKSGFTRKIDAQRYIDQLSSDMLRGSYVAPSAGNATIEQVYLEWLGTLTVKPTTKYTRETTWKKHVAPRWSNTRVGDVRKTAVQKWVADMHSSKVGVTTIENALGVLRMVLGHAVEESMVAVNVASTVKAPKRTSRRRPYLTHAQTSALVREIGETDGSMILFLAYTGMRWGEMAALRTQDFNVLRREVTITRSTAEVNGKVHIGTPKSGEARVVPLPKFLVKKVLPLMDGKGPDDLVFTTALGNVLRHSTFRDRTFKPAVQRCAKDDPTFPLHLTLHDLRHTCASLAISAGASVLVLQRMLGHASPSITLDVYSDLFQGDLHSVADALDQAVHRSIRGEVS